MREIILSTTPSIDLHGYDRESARIAVKDFLTDVLRMGEKTCIIIHGIGYGILQKEVQLYLEKDKRVESYYLSFINPGCTVVKLKTSKSK